MSYPGGKNGEGVYQRLINQIPPHDIYIETHLGAGAILRNKRPAKLNIGVDFDRDVVDSWLSKDLGKSTFVYHEDAALFIREYGSCFYDSLLPEKKTFVYCDPPYLPETRKSGPLYRYEYTKHQHIELLELLLSLKAMVMISGYRHAIYDDALKHWRRMDYMAPTRQGMVKESAWMNYEEPTELHDYRYLGDGFRSRERIKRKTKRWINNLEAMPPLERQAIITAINGMDIQSS